MTETIQVKPFREYDELICQLTDRGMLIKDPLRAQRKLTQVGYYRLSGYWHTSRKFKNVDGKIKHENVFQKNTYFENIFEFYLFDKMLRIELTNALERIEIYLRTIIAHEIGRLSPLAYLDKKQFSKNAFKADAKISYSSWLERQNRLIRESKEESIEDHRKKGKPVPIWVAAEAWDFGALSKFYSILKGSNQDLICERLGLDNRKELDNWLINLNGIRNRCAHHSRLSNRRNPRTILIPRQGFFNLLSLGQSEKNKFYSIIIIIWFLLKKIGPSSTWICRIADLIDNKPQIPGFKYKSMGFPDTGFPRKLFPETNISIVEKNPIEKLEDSSATLRAAISQIDTEKLCPDSISRLTKLIDDIVDSAEKIDELCSET
ncbi:Abi family protein [Psychromonas sp.]|uniref:Abi family protein n=1 Tax=Psychromonas sp. TaxID=1884585 RepID=UPI003566C9D2